ncbi:uncharacterized protein LOC129762386 [Toxorhynchites rutilus septentrionalis]|uniref:uncharacterized protein LOC129762386 n=1 Tax=Toxorhynchites rutilus septentrionalis TaxID=329112 RepID=UPI00247B06F0|nr:uncharacterized protein LOC129762386 [Toxorhynchites rutilus septentrionalis]
MVGCDACDGWFHCRCVGTTPEALEDQEKWFCPSDSCQKVGETYYKKLKEVKEGGKPKEIPATDDLSDKRSAKSEHQGGITLDKRLHALEKEHKAKEREMENERIVREKRIELDRLLREKQRKIDNELREKEMQQEKEFLEQELHDAKAHAHRMQEMRQSYKDAIKGIKRPSANPGAKEEGDDEDSVDEDEETERKSEKYEQVNDTRRMSNNEVISDGLGPNLASPTKAQLAARNAISRKLPIFTGKPEEWPLFVGSYEASNTACGFNDVENLVRLQESLKGPALESVRGQLLLPKSVPKVMSKLRQLYGRPEQILQKVKRLDPPKADKLETFIPFGNEVEQLCDHIEAADLQQHLINPLLIQELVDKLPEGDKREWIRFRNKEKTVTLRTLSDFLSQIVLEACEANVSFDYKPASKSMSSQVAKGRIREKGVLFNHSMSENPESDLTIVDKLKPCKMCK